MSIIGPLSAVVALVFLPVALYLGFLAAAGRGLATDADARSWSDAARSDVDAAPIAGDLAVRAREIVGTLAYSAGTPLIATHGDLHIGQILRSTAGR